MECVALVFYPNTTSFSGHNYPPFTSYYVPVEGIDLRCPTSIGSYRPFDLNFQDHFVR